MSLLPLLPGTGSDDEDAESIAQRALHSVRRHLNMEVAYLSEFVGDDIVFRLVDAPGLEDLVKVGDRMPQDQTYCHLIVDGRLPELIQNAHDHPLARTLAVTDSVPIRAHVSVPIRRRDGSVYGMFCCLSPTPNTSLTERDLDVMRMFADLSQEWVNTELEQKGETDDIHRRLDAILESDGLSIHLQPIVDLNAMRVCGYEALSRFASSPAMPPDRWFRDAASVGRGTAMELYAIEQALAHLSILPSDAYLSVNASPQTLVTGRLLDLIEGFDAQQLVLEITEHEAVSDFASFGEQMDRLRRRGVRIAVDDAGAGYAGLSRIAQISPDILKLDRSLVCAIDQHEARAAITRAMVGYVTESKAVLVAEGIETAAEMDRLLELGVQLGQGYHLCRPKPAEDAVKYCPLHRP